MEKKREPVTRFRWFRDAAGYVLSADGRRIERRGGEMRAYDPAKIDPPLHRTFPNYLRHVAVFDEMWQNTMEALPPEAKQLLKETVRSAYYAPDIELTDDPKAPFHRRRFENEVEALLGFVNAYGLLGSDRSGADAEFEDVAHLERQAQALQAAMNWCDSLSSERRIVQFADTAAIDRLAGPMARMAFGPDGRGNIAFHYEPESLYAWMWLRTAEDFSSGVNWAGEPCLFCFNEMGRGPGGYRRDAKYCSDKCRVDFSRLPQAKRKKHKALARARARNQRRA